MPHRMMPAFWGVVALQVLGLLAFAGTREFTLRSGQEVVLETAPVDPRDLFRGDYVVLRYKISTVKGCCFYVGETVYVTLAETDGVWNAVAAAHSAPSDGRLFIRGQVTKGSFGQSGRSQDLQDFNAEYGIESYFVPEGKGREIEARRGQIKARVIVDGFGAAVIKELILD